MFFNFLLNVSSSSSMFFDKNFQTKFLFPKKSTGFMFVNNILYVVICWCCVVGVFSQRVESKENRTGLNFSSQPDNNRSAGLTMSGYINKLANNLLQQQHNMQTTVTSNTNRNNATETPEEEAPLLLKNKFPVTDFQPNKKNTERKKDVFLLHSFFSKGSFFGGRNREKHEDKNKRRRPEKEVKNIKTTRVKNDDVDQEIGEEGVFRSAGSGSGLIPHSQEGQHKQITDSRFPFLRNHSDHGEDPQSDDVHIKILDTDARIRRNPNGFGRGWSRGNRYWRRPRHRGRKWRKKKRRRRWRGRSNTTTSTPPNRIETETGNRRVIISQPERKMNETHGGHSSISQGRGYTYWNVPPFVLKMKRKLENKIEQMSNMLYNGLSATLYDISRRSRYLINKYAAIKEDTKQLLSDTYDTIEDIVQMNNKIYDSVLSLSAFERRLHERIYEHGISPTAGVIPNITALANRNYHEINRQVWILLRKLKHMRNKFFQRNHTYAKHINYFNDRLEVTSDIISSQRIRIVDLMDMAMYVNNQVTNMTQFKIPKVLRQIYDKKHELITDNYHSRHRLYIAEQVHQDVTTFQKSCHLRLEELSQVNYTLLKNLPRPTRIPLTQKERRKLQQLSHKVEDHTENILRTSAEINNVLPPSINYGKKLILELSLESQSDSYKVWAFEKILNQRGQMEHAMHGKSDRRQWMKMKRKRIRRMRKKMPRLKHPVFKRNRRQVNEAEEDLNKIYDEIINMLTEIIKRLDEMWLNLFQVSPGNNGKCDPTGSEGSGGDDTEVDCERQGSGDVMSITESESGSTTSLSLTGNHDNDEGNDFVFADAKTVIMSSDHENFQSIVRNFLDRSKEQQRISRNLVHDVQDIKSSFDEVKEKKANLESDVNESAEVVSIYDGLVANATEMRRLLKETEDKIKASQEKCAAVEKLAELVMADKDEMERLLKKKIKEKEKEKRLKKKKLKDKSVDSVWNYFDAKTKMEEKSGKKWGKKDKEEEEEDFSEKIFEENEETKAELRALIEKYLRLQKKEEEIKGGKKEKENNETGKEHLNKTRKGRGNKNDSNEKNKRLNKTRNEKNRSDSIKKKNRKKKESAKERNERVKKKESEKKKNKIGKRRGEKTEDLPSWELEEDGRRNKMEEEKMEGEKINVKKKKKTERRKNNEKLSHSKKESQAIGNERGEIDVSSVLEIKKNLERVLAKLNERLTHSKKWSHQERRKKRKRMKRKKIQSLNDVALADRKIIANEKEEGKLNEKEGKERNKEEGKEEGEGKERNKEERKERNEEGKGEGKERNKEERKERNEEGKGEEKEKNKEEEEKERNEEEEEKDEGNEINKEKQDEGKERNKQREGKEERKERRERKGKRTKMKKKQNLNNVALADRKIIANEKEENVNSNEKDEKEKKKTEREENEEGKEKNEEERKGEEEGKGRGNTEERERKEEEKRRRSKEKKEGEEEEGKGRRNKEERKGEEEGKGRRNKEERKGEEEEKRRRSKEKKEGEEEGKKRRDKNEKERMKNRKTEDKERRTKKNGGKEKERKKEKNEEENKRNESKEVGEKKDRKNTDVNAVKRIKTESKTDHRKKDEFKESRRNETIEKNAAIKESETNSREEKKNETKTKERIKNKKESSVERITVESKDNSNRKKRRRNTQKNVLEFDNKKNFRNRTKIEREDPLKDEENKRKTKEKKENKQRKKEKESKEMKENEGKSVKKRKGKKMRTMNEKRKKGTELNSEKELNDILEEKNALKTPERRSKNDYEEEEEEENGMSLKNLMNEKTKEIKEEKKINKRKREKEKRREKNRKRQENRNEFGAKEEEEEREKKNENERNIKKKKKDNKKAGDKKKKIDRPNKETNAILMALGMNFEKRLRIPQTIKSKQKKSKRIRLSEKVASPPILIQNEEQSLAEEMTNKSKEIEEDVHKTKKAVESIVNQLKEFSPDPCRVISKNIHQIRMNISGLIQKIQLARTIVSSMKIPVSLNGEQQVELELYPKSEASEIQTSVEICLKPQNPNSVILTLQANNSIGYSLSLVDSKPVLNVVDSNGKVKQTLESDIELKEDDWYQVFIHRFGQNFSLSINRKDSELGNTMVQRNILDLEPEQIPPSLAYLGGYPHNFPTENSEKLKGCIAYLTINGRFTHLFSPLETGSYPSVCKNGCESVRNTSIVFEGNGFAFLEFDGISEKTLDSIQFTFKTLQANALLLAIQKNSEMLLLILLTEGNLQIERKWKSSKIVKRSQGIQFSNGDQHSIQITSIEKQLGIKISSQEVEFEDKEENATDDDDDEDGGDLFDEGITLGGISTIAKNTSKYRSFTGCLSNVSINNKPLNLLYLKNGSHVYEGDCQKNVWVSCSHFTESSLPVSLTKYDYVRSISLLIDRNAQGTFLFLERESKFNLEFQLTRNSLEIFNLENEESRTIPKINGSDFWHLLHIKDQKGNIHITLDADQSVDLSYEEDTGGWFASNANDFSMVVSVGGKLKGESETQKTFTGSISNFYIGNLKLYLNKEFGSSNNLSVCSRPSFKTFSKQLDCTVSVKE